MPFPLTRPLWLLILSGFTIACLFGAWLFLRVDPPEIGFVEYSDGNGEDVSIVFRLTNSGRFDLHYSIETLPTLRKESRTREVGLLPANSILTNKIPIQILDKSFHLQVDVFRLPVLPKRWFMKPGLSWRCAQSFFRGESRLMYSFDGTLPTHRGARIATPLVAARGENPN